MSTTSTTRASCQADIDPMTQEDARQWLIANDREAADYWAELPADTDFREAVSVNCRDFGFDEPEAQGSTQPTTLPPGPYRFEPGETADTYRIFAAGDDKPMAELIYIGGDEDFAATAEALARLFTAAPRLRSVLQISADRLLALIEEGRDMEADMEAYQEACGALAEVAPAAGKEAA